MGLTLFALRFHRTSRRAPRAPLSQRLLPSPTNPTPLHNAPTSPAQTTQIQFNFAFGSVLCPHSCMGNLFFPSPSSPTDTCHHKLNSAQFARFSTSSTNTPCPFDTHDHRTIHPMTFDFPSLTPRGFSEIIATPPLSFEASPSAFSGKDVRPQKHERGRQKRFPPR